MDVQCDGVFNSAYQVGVCGARGQRILSVEFSVRRRTNSLLCTVCGVQCTVAVQCTHGQQSERAVRSHQLGGTRGDSRSWHAAHRASPGSASEDRGHSEDPSTM